MKSQANSNSLFNSLFDESLFDSFELPNEVTVPRLRLVRRPRNALRKARAERARADEGGHRATYLLMKRVFDLIGALTLLMLTAPLMALTALAVRLTSSGPIILRQKRLTLGGRKFTLLKFRTMRADAEKLSGPVFAGEDDPRITPVGKFMRKTRLDELPQLWNVVCGEMSLIGPRPERPEIAAQLKESILRFDKRLAAKAGLTGLAQVVQGYPDGVDGYKKKLAWDVVYIRKQSLMLDLWIAFRTVGVIMTGSGAR